ncbi:MAG: DUF3040 domain-containing protein [Pseudonocardia sp.]|nr:DUF3040 domain-containing protein [Pseudonocardia sp.]
MLSDHEMKTLRELERQLLDDDPEFPRRFDTRARRLGGNHLGMPAATAIAVVMVLAAVLLVAGAPGAALGLVTVTGVLWLAWRWCYATTSDNSSRDDHHST